jgi:hypothetical protein
MAVGSLQVRFAFLKDRDSIYSLIFWQSYFEKLYLSFFLYLIQNLALTILMVSWMISIPTYMYLHLYIHPPEYI